MRTLPTAPATGLASAFPSNTACSLALAAAVAASARDEVRPVEPDALLLALGAEMDRREAALVAMRAAVYPDIDEKNAEAWAAYRAADDAMEALIEHRIAPMRATTPAGIAVKARALAYLYHPESFLRDHLERTVADVVLRSLVDDVTPAAAPVPHPDAVLLDLGRQWHAIEREWEETEQETDVEMHERTDREGAIIDAIAACRAITLAGLAVKARILARENDCEAPACLSDAGIVAWAAPLLQEKVWLDRIIGSLCLDLLGPAQETGL